MAADHRGALQPVQCAHTAREGERAHMLGIYGSRQALPSAFSESPWNQSWVGLGHTFWLDYFYTSGMASVRLGFRLSTRRSCTRGPLARTAARTHISTHNPLDDLVAKSRCRTDR